MQNAAADLPAARRSDVTVRSKTGKEELHDLVDLLPDAEAADALDYVQWLLAEEDTLTAEEMELVRLGMEAIARGDYVTLGELKRDLAK